MPNKRNPRHGSMQFWPRKRANMMYARVRHWAKSDKKGLLGFAGYKSGMTHGMVIDGRQHSQTKGEEIQMPFTIVECPPLKIFSARFYKLEESGLRVAKELSFKADKELARKITPAKKTAESLLEKIKADDYEDITVTLYTLPRLSGIKKKPELFEMHLGGSKEDKLNFIKEHTGKEISVSSVFKKGQFVDIHSVTKGRGLQGPVKRFGIGLKPHKSEKGRRAPGSLGGWRGQGHVMYRVAHAGQMGFHQRVQYNNKIMEIFSTPEKVNPRGGFINYGLIKSNCLLLKGSVPGSKKRMIIMIDPIRAREQPSEMNIAYISTSSKQGN